MDALANFWVDYTLLALKAREDSLLTTLDFDPLLRPELEQEIIDAYMDSVLRADTAISDQDLRAMWEADPPADSVRAQHILLALPEQATEAQVDSVVNLAEQLRARAAAGESFEALASQYSEDSGSAVQGGDIGFFGRGMLVPALEEAAFSLAVGEVGGPVSSSFGLHVIKVTDRKAATFEAARSTFRDSLVLGRLREADSILLAEIEEEGEIEVEAGAVDVLRELAMNPKDSAQRQGSGPHAGVIPWGIVLGIGRTAPAQHAASRPPGSARGSSRRGPDRSPKPPRAGAGPARPRSRRGNHPDRGTRRFAGFPCAPKD